MKLYYSPGACSMSPHILTQEAGIPLELVKVDLKSKKTEHDDDFTAINPKGYVPALALDDGRVITEGVAIDLYLGGLKPEAELVPAADSPQYLEFLEWMLFITTELHKGFSPLFAPLPEEAKTMLKKKLEPRLAYVAKALDGKDYLFHNRFTAADAYLFTVLNWAPKVKLDLSEWPVFETYTQRLADRPAVQMAMKLEGLR